MTAALFQSGKIDVGHVVKETFGVIGRHFATLAGLSLVMLGVPSALVDAAQLMAGPSGGEAATFIGGSGGLAVAILGLILQGALTRAVVMDLTGRQVVLADCLSTGLRAFLPLLAIGLLYALAAFFAAFLLIVPGVMVAVAWCVAVPAYIAEHTGITGSFGRSATLTRGNRWRIFGLFLLWAAALLVVGVAYVSAIGLGNFTQSEAAAVTPVSLVLDLLVNTLTGLVSAAGFAVLYVELRRVREGQGPESLADIFA
jgi:hypothetical protein